MIKQTVQTLQDIMSMIRFYKHVKKKGVNICDANTIQLFIKDINLDTNINTAIEMLKFANSVQ